MQVSVIIPNYNNAPFLRECIESVVLDPAVGEVIVYDNASTDASIEVIESLGHDKVRLIRGSDNLGATLARHEAVKLASNPVVCFLDGDDYLGEQSVSAAVARMAEQNLDYSLFNLMRVSKDGKDAFPFIELPRDVIDGRTAFDLTVGGWGIHGYGVIRRDHYLRTTADFQFHGYTDDELLTSTLFLKASRVAGGSGTYFYRIMPKAYAPRKFLSATRSAVRLMKLARDNGIGGERLRKARNSATRGVFRLAREARRGEVDKGEFCRLFEEYRGIGAGWRASDWREMSVDMLMRPVAAYWSRGVKP